MTRKITIYVPVLLPMLIITKTMLRIVNTTITTIITMDMTTAKTMKIQTTTMTEMM